jgi:hypothetical protein
MAKCGYTVAVGADVALAAATAKTVLGVKSGAAFGLDLQKISVTFDGVTSTAEPVLVELCYSTWATNSPGTNSTSETEVQVYGRVIADGTTAASNWTAEPTALTVLDEFLIHPQTGLKEYIPLGFTPDCAVDHGFVIRCTAPAIVNCRAGLWWERA